MPADSKIHGTVFLIFHPAGDCQSVSPQAVTDLKPKPEWILRKCFFVRLQGKDQFISLFLRLHFPVFHNSMNLHGIFFSMISVFSFR